MNATDRARIAEVIRAHVEHDPPPQEIGGGIVLCSVAGMFADLMEEEGGLDFGRGRFFKACGFKLTRAGDWKLP